MRAIPKTEQVGAGNTDPFDRKALKQAQNKYQTESVRSTASVTTFPRRRQTLRRRAAIRLAELYRLALFRRQHGLSVDPNGFAFALAATLECGRPGTMLIRGRVNRAARQEARPQEIRWPGLTMVSLREAISRADIGDFADAELWTLIEAVERFADEHGMTLIGAAKLGEMLQLTSIERQECRLRSIDAVDEPRDERIARLREERRQRDREEKRAKRGRVPRAIYESRSLSKSKPWEAFGIGRRQWERRGRPLPDVASVSADDISHIAAPTHLRHDATPSSIRTQEGPARLGGGNRGDGADGHSAGSKTFKVENSLGAGATAFEWRGDEVSAFRPRPRIAEPGEPPFPELTGRVAQVIGLIEAAAEALVSLQGRTPRYRPIEIAQAVSCLETLVNTLWMSAEADCASSDEIARAAGQAAAGAIFDLGANDNRATVLAQSLAA